MDNDEEWKKAIAKHLHTQSRYVVLEGYVDDGTGKLIKCIYNGTPYLVIAIDYNNMTLYRHI